MKSTRFAKRGLQNDLPHQRLLHQGVLREVPYRPQPHGRGVAQSDVLLRLVRSAEGRVILRCPECRTRRKSFDLFTRHLRETGHRVCWCGGYSFAHRPGSPYCEQNAMSAVRIAARQEWITADELLEIAVDCAWEKAGRPFTKWRD